MMKIYNADVYFGVVCCMLYVVGDIQSIFCFHEVAKIRTNLIMYSEL
jgi:hypothetical protein